MLVRPIKTKLFKENENLLAFLDQYLPKIKYGDVVVVTSKIVALSEGRFCVAKNEKFKEKMIKQESDFAIKTKYAWLTIKDGDVLSSAGIDESNANGKLILLPKNNYKSAKIIHNYLRKKYNIKKIGVIITDSRLFPLRAGVVGIALGYYGFKGIKNYIGTPDLFGRKFKVSKTDIADSLATAAVLVMGEGTEKQPLCVISNAPIEFTDKTNRKELKIDIKEDIYKPLFEKI
ncbi:MAG: coenzyme F420-0:L-glutamate ligase [Candidatus Magasanikbacteria bacterium]|nr:coenzyme F420-0:L-glutamate ligase [Candidatus Magasanikbacteria bacterium]